ncbi:hypothetical protein [Streptomyces sp. CAU 1734]|uniref:hypothetical protein n=1 Tax=Streptomyces sp. CAU 1734 TaxID=3140360 RepID=UPI003260DE14
MRLRNALATGVIAATAALLPLPALAADDSRQPRCGTLSGKDFPIDTRILGVPSVHRPGAGFAEWSVELTNTTDRVCRNIHPVIVFAPRDSGLTPANLAVEFHDGTAARWRPTEPETTSEDEVVVVLDDVRERGTSGVTVRGRATVTVRVRVALAEGTPANEVTVNAAIVQRRGGDGDWVGASGEHRFTVPGDGGGGADGGTGTPDGRDELATTGTASLPRLGAALGTVLLGAGALFLVSRRLRPPGR